MRWLPLPPFANVPDPQRKLRIGFVSADLRGYLVAYFFQLLLQQLDRQQSEVYCYYNNRRSDDTTEAMQRLADGWRNVATMTDEMALQIRRCHRSAGGFMRAHRRQPPAGICLAPGTGAIHYSGYAATSGMRSIDYIPSAIAITRRCRSSTLLRGKTGAVAGLPRSAHRLK